MMQGKQGFSKHKTIMIGVQVFIAALAAETDKDIKHLVYNPVGQQCSDWAFESGGNLLFPDHCWKQIVHIWAVFEQQNGSFFSYLSHRGDQSCIIANESHTNTGNAMNILGQ